MSTLDVFLRLVEACAGTSSCGATLSNAAWLQVFEFDLLAFGISEYPYIHCAANIGISANIDRSGRQLFLRFLTELPRHHR
jgi:hypothetical protein